MMYQLVCISLDTKIGSLPAQQHELRRMLRNIDKLRDILFAESYKFFRFVKAKDTKMCVDVPLSKAFDMLENFFHCLSYPDREEGDYVRTCYEAVSNLM